MNTARKDDEPCGGGGGMEMDPSKTEHHWVLKSNTCFLWLRYKTTISHEIPWFLLDWNSTTVELNERYKYFPPMNEWAQS